MTDPWDPSAPPPQTYAPPTYGYQQYDGPPGRVRSTGKVLLLTIVTLGIYTYVYNYQVHDEMKRHSGRGIGGGIALLLTFLAGIAMPFITPAEVGNLYTRKNAQAPVNGWTGLWLIVPAIGGYIGLFAVLIIAGVASDTSGDDTAVGVAFVVLGVLWLAAVIAGGLVWLMRTNGALNRYWQGFSPSA